MGLAQQPKDIETPLAADEQEGRRSILALTFGDRDWLLEARNRLKPAKVAIVTFVGKTAPHAVF